VAGNDANPGTAAQPLRTISAAFAQAASGASIWLADGVWDSANEPAVTDNGFGLNCKADGSPLVGGTTLRAVNPGRATIRYVSLVAMCVRDSQVRGIRLESARTDFATVTAINALGAGNSLLSGVSFDGGMIWVHAGAKLTMEPAGLASYGNPGSSYGFAIYADGAGSEAIVNGGAFDRLSPVQTSNLGNCLAALSANRGARLVLNQVVLLPGPPRHANANRSNAVAACSSEVELNGVTASGFVGGTTTSSGVALGLYGGRATLNGTALSGNRYGAYVTSGTLILAGASRIEGSELDGALIDGNSSLIVSGASAVRGNGGHGVSLSGQGGDPLVDVVDADFAGNGKSGLSLQAVHSCKVRNSTFTGNVDAGITLRNATHCDLGSAASPGGNAFAGNVGPGFVGAPSSTDAAFTVLAVGNAWTANQQGADAQGRYTVPAGKTVYEVTGKTTGGANYRLDWTNVTLRLAE
jgi:hypothetical protein